MPNQGVQPKFNSEPDTNRCAVFPSGKSRQREVKEKEMETRFGRLTILKYYVGGAVRCRCDCGKEFVEERLYIHNGQKLDCGCGISSKNETDDHKNHVDESYPVVLGNPHSTIDPGPGGRRDPLPNLDESKELPDTHGFIYVLINRAMPGIVKIGKTKQLPEKRAAELSTSTGVPLPYQVYYAVKVLDCHKAERFVHERLAFVRDNFSREFFSISPDMAKVLIDEVVAANELK